MAFFVIHIPMGLPEHVRRAVGKETSGSTYSRSSPSGLLRSAGFRDIEELDVSDEYLRVARMWDESWTRHEEAARAALGDAAFDDQRELRRKSIAAIERGQLKRSLLVARR